MRVLELSPGHSPRQWGQAHGESFAKEIAELAEIRLELIRVNWEVETFDPILETARRHLPVLEDFDRDLWDELHGISQGSRVDPARIVVLNHYTDLRDLKPKESPEEGCSVVYSRSQKGTFLGQTWDMHASSEPYVMMLKVPEPEMWVLTITGCLALCGMTSNGLGVCINNLLSLDAQVGVVWPALVRKMLAAGSPQAAHQLLLQAPVGSGHHYLVADKSQVFGVETSGIHRKTVYRGEQPFYYHTNHCLDEAVAASSQVSPTSTTHLRYSKLEQLFTEPADFDQLWNLLGSKDGYPKSLFTNLATANNPHAMFTCARILMDLEKRRLMALPGWEGTGPGKGFTFEAVVRG